jgi:membrane-bound lytic murein transglycosylase D
MDMSYCYRRLVVTAFYCCSVVSQAYADTWLPNIIRTDLWDRLRSDFSLPENYKSVPAVQAQLRWYKKHPEHLDAIIHNAEPYLEYVISQVEERGLPGEIALLPFIESNFNAFAYSRVGATGIWQMMPGTASGYGVTINWWYDGRRDIVESTKTALDYLTYLGDYFHQNWLHAIAAYDSGEGKVRKAVRQQEEKKMTNFWTLRLPNETKSYLPKLIALKEIIQHPDAYDIELPNIENTSQFTVFTIPKQVDLQQVATLAAIDMKTLRTYNPGYRRMATPPHSEATLLIPYEKTATFKQNITLLSSPKAHKTEWKKHTVQPGESLSKIAEAYHTTTSIIKQSNQLKNNTIRIHQVLIIPEGDNGQGSSERDMHVSSTISQDKIPGPKLITHEAKKDETLEHIAKRYHVTVGQLEFWNNLHAYKKLQGGEKVTLWSSRKAQAKPKQYRVKAGDTLSGIAYKFHTTVKALKQKNKLTSDRLRQKQLLVI